LGRTFKVIGTKIYSFGLGGRFLFASVMTEKVPVPPLPLPAVPKEEEEEG